MTSSYVKYSDLNKGLLAETTRHSNGGKSGGRIGPAGQTVNHFPSNLTQRKPTALAWEDGHSHRSLLGSKGRLKGSSAPNGTKNRKQHTEMVFCPCIGDYYPKQPGFFQ